MAIKPRISEGKEFEKIPGGTFPAVCIGVYDLGMQTTMWQGKEKQQYKLMFVWETAEKDSKGESFYVMKKYTNSLAEKAYLRKDIKGWMGRDLSPDEAMNLDFEEFIGRQCILSIVHSEDGKYANVNSVSQPITGVKVEFTGEVPEWIKKAIAKQQGGLASNTNDVAAEKAKSVFSVSNTKDEETQVTEENNDPSAYYNDVPEDGVPF